MTLYEIRKRVKEIKDVGIDNDDAETAHVFEDELHIDFIKFVAEHAPDDLKVRARAVLRTSGLNFPRWCA